MANLLEFEAIKKFIATLGKDIEGYFGKDKAALVYLKPDGVWYAEGLYQWLKKKKKNVTITSMEDDGEGLEEEKIQGRKVLIVLNESFSGKAHKRSIEAIRTRKERLNIKGIKLATYRDRPGTADFSVDRYSAETIWHMDEVDALDLKIMQILAQDGRTSMSAMAKKTNLSAVAVKNRIDRLLRQKIFKIQGVLNIDRFYNMSAHIQIEADEKTVDELIEKLEQHHEVYHIAKKVSGKYNLLVGMVATNLESVEDFVEREIRTIPGVRNLGVFLGSLPILPKTFFPRL